MMKPFGNSIPLFEVRIESFVVVATIAFLKRGRVPTIGLAISTILEDERDYHGSDTYWS